MVAVAVLMVVELMVRLKFETPSSMPPAGLTAVVVVTLYWLVVPCCVNVTADEGEPRDREGRRCR